MKIFLRLILNAIALLLVSNFVPGVHIDSTFSAFIAAIILGIVNIVIRPILLLLTLPINLITLGIFTFVINALMLELVAAIVKGFTISGFTAAFSGAILLWLLSMVIDRLLITKDV